MTQADATMLEAIEDRVVVRPDEGDAVSRGGVIIPDTAKEKPKRGTVVAVGPGKLLPSGERMPMAVQKGDTVVYDLTRIMPGKFTVDNVEYVVMTEKEVLARMN